MTTYALEGTGSTIAFSTSSFTSDLITLTLPEVAREVIETTHLGTTVAKTFKPAKLVNVGTISCEFDHDPNATALVKRDPETITISYPLLTGQTTPTRLVFTGFATAQGGEEFKTDSRMTTKVTLQVTGDMTVVPAT